MVIFAPVFPWAVGGLVFLYIQLEFVLEDVYSVSNSNIF